MSEQNQAERTSYEMKNHLNNRVNVVVQQRKKLYDKNQWRFGQCVSNLRFCISFIYLVLFSFRFFRLIYQVNVNIIESKDISSVFLERAHKITSLHLIYCHLNLTNLLCRRLKRLRCVKFPPVEEIPTRKMMK